MKVTIFSCSKSIPKIKNIKYIYHFLEIFFTSSIRYKNLYLKEYIMCSINCTHIDLITPRKLGQWLICYYANIPRQISLKKLLCKFYLHPWSLINQRILLIMHSVKCFRHMQPNKENGIFKLFFADWFSDRLLQNQSLPISAFRSVLNFEVLLFSFFQRICWLVIIANDFYFIFFICLAAVSH